MKVWWLTLAILLTTTATALAATQGVDAPPSFAHYGVVGRNSSVSMMCEGDAPYDEIECEFTLLRLVIQSEEETMQIKKGLAVEVDATPASKLNKKKKNLGGRCLLIC